MLSVNMKYSTSKIGGHLNSDTSRYEESEYSLFKPSQFSCSFELLKSHHAAKSDGEIASLN